MYTLAAWAISLVFALCSLFPQRRKIVFLSRQSSRPLDFALLEPELRRRWPDRDLVWCCVPEIDEMSVSLMLRQIWHAATAEVCLVDGYVPAVSVPRHHRAYVVQLWHAPGAIKKFGYQSLDTPAGRSSATARILRMHRGYDCVVSGVPGATGFFAEAFDMDPSRIRALGLPCIDYLVSPDYEGLRAERFSRAERHVNWAFSDPAVGPDEPPLPDTTTVIYAPTFRRGGSDPLWLEHAVEGLERALAGSATNVRLVVAGHPLEVHQEGGEDLDVRPRVRTGVLRGATTMDALHVADYVLTDYSTVAFEAGMLGKRVLFYVPDIEEYRRSPGLNIDPVAELPTLSSADAHEVAEVIIGERPYDQTAFDAFFRSQVGDLQVGAIGRIADLLGTEGGLDG